MRLPSLALSATAALTILATAAAQQPTVDLGGNKSVVVPVTIRFLRAVVPVTINAQGPYDFFFDPGSQGFGIEASLVETLKLPAVKRAGVKSGQKITGSQIVSIEKMEFFGITLSGGQAIVFPRGTFGGGGQPVGMLTPTLFPGYVVTLDFPGEQLKFEAGKLPNPDRKQVFAYLDRGALPALRIDVAGVAVNAQIDTNSSGGLTLPRSYAKRVPLMSPPTEAGKVRSSRGEFTYADATIKGTVKIGRFTLENPPVRFSDVVKRGDIGQEILKDFALTIDIRQRRFKLERPAGKEK